jgi:hypothetical protein
MKLHTTVNLQKISVDGEEIQIGDRRTVDIEFSAIDTGGGFHNPIMDIAYTVDISGDLFFEEDEEYAIKLLLSDPDDESNTLEIRYKGKIEGNKNRISGMGRLQEEEVGDKAMAFVMKRFRNY